MDLLLKNGLTLKEKAYLIISDLHLSKYSFNSIEIINKLKCNKNLSLILLGDTFQENRKKVINYNKELMDEISKHNPIYICGNNDPDYGYDYATFNGKILCHGNQFCFLTKFKFINCILNLFKSKVFRGENLKPIPDNIKNKLVKGQYIIGHFHKDCYIIGSRLLAPRTVYLMTKNAVIKL